MPAASRKARTFDPSRYVGRVFGRLTVLRRLDRRRVQCRCECGTEKPSWVGNLLRGDTVSCGCYRVERSTTHGHTKGHRWTAEYAAWSSMVDRCTRTTRRDFKHYGGRGITVCQRWRESFEAFLAEVGASPGVGYSIDRIDNDRGYEPGNVRWATHKEQCQNRRNNAIFTCFGETLTVGEWERRTGIPAKVIRQRITERKWPPERALTQPLKFAPPRAG